MRSSNPLHPARTDVMSNPLLDSVVDLCRAAGAAILEVYHDEFEVDWKADRTPVTTADRASHRVLVDGLLALDPAIPVLSEEGDAAEWSEAARSGRFWLVDPLDGTREFLKRTGEFTVNVALVSDGRPVLGVVQIPVSGAVYTGTVADGRGRAFRLDADGTSTPLHTVAPEPGRIRLAASRDHGGPLVAAVEARADGGVELRRAGSSLKFCLVAEGEADLYVRDGRTMEWDTAAADTVLQAAGGRVLSLDGEPLRYGVPPFANPPFVAVGHPALDWNALIREYRD